MSTVGNGTTGASGTGPASGYNPVLSHLFIMFFLLLYRLSANTSNPYTAIMLLIFTHSMICFIIFEIKIYRKMPKTLTIDWYGFEDGDGLPTYIAQLGDELQELCNHGGLLCLTAVGYI
jgi:hypothetical protein